MPSDNSGVSAHPTSTHELDSIDLAVLTVLFSPIVNLRTVWYIAQLHDRQRIHLCRLCDELRAHTRHLYSFSRRTCRALRARYSMSLPLCEMPRAEVEPIARALGELSTVEERTEELQREVESTAGKMQRFRGMYDRGIDECHRMMPEEDKIRCKIWSLSWKCT